jgi:hypothetical protein
MIPGIRRVGTASALTLVLTGATAAAQKAAGILRIYSAESPPGVNITSRRRRGARGRSWASTTI